MDAAPRADAVGMRVFEDRIVGAAVAVHILAVALLCLGLAVNPPLAWAGIALDLALLPVVAWVVARG